MKICFTTFVFGMSAFVSQLAHAQDEPKTPPPVSGRSVTEEEIIPGDVLARVQLLRDELELIRFEMGKPENGQPEIPVTKAAPREVFFQGITLLHKTNRLCFELTRSGEEPETPPVSNLRPYHVWSVVDRALKRVLLVKRKLELKEECKERVQPESTTPNQVFRSIVQANRQMNLLLERRFSPSDVFQQVTLAMNYGSRLLARFPDARRIPQEPAFERGKRPDDVFKRLIECYGLVQRIAHDSGVEMLDLNIDEATIKGKTPSDVYDIASLIVSELAYLHTLLDNSEAPAKVYYPGRKFPSHVFQRAGMLKTQLEEFKKRVQENPGWIKE